MLASYEKSLLATSILVFYFALGLHANAQSNSALQPTSPNFGSQTTLSAFNPFPTGGFWIQGVNFGLTFRY